MIRLPVRRAPGYQIFRRLRTFRTSVGLIQPLTGNQIGELAAFFDQFLICSFLCDRSVLHHQFRSC